MNVRLKSTLNKIPSIARFIMVALVIAFISWLFPNNTKFKYEFEEGQSWKYNELVAPFDFAILKPEADIAAERKKIEEEFSPFYTLDFEITKEQKACFLEKFQRQLSMEGSEQFPDVQARPQRYINYSYALLDRVYSKGIVQLAPQHEEKEKDFVINILKGNTTQKYTLASVSDISAAKNFISDTLPYSSLEHPEFLLPVLDSCIVANIFYNDSLTHKLLSEELVNISPTYSKVRKGETIVPKNGIVTADIYNKLRSFKEQYEEEITERKSFWGVLIGYILLSTLIIGVFLIYMSYYMRPIFTSFVNLSFVLLWIVLYSYITYAVENIELISVYIIPFTIAPIVIKTFFDEGLAIFTHIVVVLIASFITSLGFEFTFLQILAGLGAVLSNVDTRNWSSFFYGIIYIFLTYALGYFGLSLIQSGSIHEIDWTFYNWLFFNVFLVLLAYPLIPLLERIFGFISPLSLVELSDMNRPLLRDLALKSPGTLQHALQVANLAEAAANEIGADTLLVRVGALYHDIGKTLNPAYYIENQNSRNPHDNLTPLESAKIILAHVSDGVKLAQKQRLPKVLIDFIRTHHGTTRVQYFYQKQVAENPNKEIDASLFTYDGPKPQTKEQVIMMMADSLEAACKSLKSPTAEVIDEFIDKIIQGKISSGQFEECNLSFQELEKCKKVFKQMMKSIHHVRMEY